MITILFALTGLAAGLECLAVFNSWREVEYFAKPAAMLFLLGWLLLSGGLDGPLLWFALGVAFSLAGDVILLLPDEERWFSFGLGAFLLAHVAYILGFNFPPPPLNGLTFGVAFMVIISVLPLIRRILLSMRQKGLDALLLPVRVYATIISLVLFSALMTLFRVDWLATPAYLVSLGAALFLTSDLTLAWGKFIKPVRNGAALVMVTYYLGQVLLVAGAVGQFGNISR